MVKIITDLDSAIGYLNSLYEFDDTAPSSGDEDYVVWTGLFNTAINLWETEEGVLWKELFVKLVDASDGDKTSTAGDYSYACPTDFVFTASAYVWLGTGTNKLPYKVIDISETQLHENSSEKWCYFVQGSSPTLEFNPNITLPDNYTISYNYYKHATKLTTGSDTFEMGDPMFAVFYGLGELKKEEGDSTALAIATQKLDGMKMKNEMPTWFQSQNTLINNGEPGMGV